MIPRPGSLRTLIVCFLPLLAGQAIAQDQNPQPQTPPPPKPAKQNPFETVPVAPQEPKPEPAKPAPTPQVQTVSPDRPPEDIIEAIDFRGVRRVPQDTLRAMIFTKPGDPYNEESLHRDFMALWNTNRFDDIHMEREAGTRGWIIRFVLVERRIVRSIKYDGLKSLQQSEVLDRFKERKVGLSVESQYDPNKVQRAKNVLLDYLAERGRQFATVEPEIRQVPPSSLEITFKVDEGPKVKVNQITFTGNQVFSHRVLLRAMKALRPIGIPYSIFFESLFPRTYDSTKLEDDISRLELFYKDNGFFKAHVTDSSTQIVDTGGGRFRLPLFWSNKPGKGVDIKIGLEEGQLYYLNQVNYVGVKAFRTPETLFASTFGKPGDVFSTAKLRKGFEEVRKLYGNFGYINFVAEPDFEEIPGSNKINLTLTFDEGRQFFVRRIDFSGNTTTRDKVIRRELLIDEGDIFNTRLWELSILRLNQLGYFETLKEDESVDIKTDTKTDTVDITLKVKERAKNSIQLQGGVSGIAGSFLGLSYSTNNFLGLGETLSIGGQVGTRMQNVNFSFTQPYFLDRPLAAGFTVFIQRFNYDQAREASILAGANLLSAYQGLGAQNLLNYVSNSKGFTVFSSYPLKRSFARVGLSYGYTWQNIQTLTTAAQVYYDYLNFLNFNGPNALSGIRSSNIIPSYTYNSVNHPISPTGGKSLSVSTTFSGSFLGGNVNQIMPVIDGRYFRKGFKTGHVIGMHFTARYLTGYGSKVAPPFNRFYIGGENDIRGFENWGVSPIAYVPSTGTVNVYNADGTPRQQKYIDPSTGAVSLVNVTQQVPSYQLVFPGGDGSLVGNLEYRIPIAGPVTMAIFLDAGVNRILNTTQLELNAGHIAQLNQQFPEAGFVNKALVAPGTQAVRMSTGIEIQVLMPVVNAPFRIYWAYNPLRVDEYLQPPIAADRSYFPNSATYNNAISVLGQPLPFFEKSSIFRFTVGRTF
ncbi:MAG: outer membrane protein assembly factor BamA [Bryobacterales bacterium]|nr:outer membrane protein assembly factor BamA [Bryobacterales bacterium]MBV9399221.1 outer membrane protein assembly factor BamA [Bryobacterales bacterium]